jgi:hypothetical protein
MEILGFGIMGIGSLIALIGWIWLVVLGFQVGGALWGILNIFFQPITGLIFCIMNKTGWMQFAMMIIGYVLAIGGMIPAMMSAVNSMPR